jgi:hypothetical protein
MADNLISSFFKNMYIINKTFFLIYCLTTLKTLAFVIENVYKEIKSVEKNKFS